MHAIISIRQHALKVPVIVAVIEQCERQFLWKSPFNAIAQVHGVPKETSDKAQDRVCVVVVC